MGAHPYWYYVKYNPDIDAALQDLRQREFQAGRYNPVLPFLDFPLDLDFPTPGAQHTSIEEAQEAAAEDGTRSILDLYYVSDTPEFGAVTHLDDDVIQSLYGTNKPTREMVEKNMDFLEEVERLQGVYLIVYKNNKPDEICFAGYSAD